MFIIFFISALAETNRPPFDLPEAESELVAGFMVEYGSTPYMMFMLGEYAAIVLVSSLTTILFLGGWLPPVDIAPFNWVPGIFWFVAKTIMVFFMISLVKAFCTALPLRSVDAPGLEGVFTNFTIHGVCHGTGAADHRLGGVGEKLWALQMRQNRFS